MTLEIHPLVGIGVVSSGDDVASVLTGALEPLRPLSGDVIVVTHKIVSKTEGALRQIVGDPAEFKKLLV